MVIKIPVSDFRIQQVPGWPDSLKVVHAHIRATDLPSSLKDWMEVNPRLPKIQRNQKVAGDVAKKIRATLIGESIVEELPDGESKIVYTKQPRPDMMVHMSRGLTLLAQHIETETAAGGQKFILITLDDKESHGLVDGGHTFCVIMEVRDQILSSSNPAPYVLLTIKQGIPSALAYAVAEGLNTSRQVDKESILNLQGAFDPIHACLRNKFGDDIITYFQGDDGDMHVLDVIARLEMFNIRRFSDNYHPSEYFKKKRGIAIVFEEDLKNNAAVMTLLMSHADEILRLSDKIQLRMPEILLTIGRKIHKKKVGRFDKEIMPKVAEYKLPFIGEMATTAVPEGIIMPILAAFRANVIIKPDEQQFGWKIPLDELLDLTIDDLSKEVMVAIDANKDGDDIKKDSTIYSNCYLKVRLAVLEYAGNSQLLPV